MPCERPREAGGAVDIVAPAYVHPLESGEFARRVEAARRRLGDCDLCARYCRVERRATIDALRAAARFGLARLDRRHRTVVRTS